MFDTTAKRIVEENDFFVGNWTMLFIRTPNGDAKMTAKITREGGGLQGKLISDDSSAEPIMVSEIVEEDEKFTLYFTAQGYDVNVSLTKTDEDNMKGTLYGYV